LAKPDVDAVMRLHIEATGRDYAYRLELFDSMSNTPEGERVVTNACELCGLEEVGSLIEVSAVTLLERYARASAPATLSIETTPSGAEVFDNGESLGRTPLEVLVVPGNHELELKLAGHEVRHRTVLVGSAETIAMNTELLRVRPPRHWKRMVIGGSVTFLAGLGLSAGGAYLVAIDSKSIGSSSDPESGCQPDSNGNCQDLYDTLGVGAATLTLGVVHLVVGAVLVGVGLAWRHDERKVAFRFDGVRVRF
jgi:hypothetical protein